MRRLQQKLSKIGLIKHDYKDYVKKVARENPDSIDQGYFKIMKEKADSVAGFIPPSTSTVLDIGCGIAALDLFLFEKLDISKIILLDNTKVEDKIWYMFEEEGAFYNSLDVAKETLTKNGVDPSIVHLVEAPSDGVIPLEDGSVDLVLSTLSWGFHYPIGIYIDSVVKILSDQGAVIVDVRRDTDGAAAMRKALTVEVIDETEKVQTLKGVK